MGAWHVPVLLSEVLGYLLARPDGVFLDGTTGTAGHAEAIVHALAPQGRLICVDFDPDALNVAKARLGDQGGRVTFHRCCFSELEAVLRAESLPGVDGILLDLGLNSWSLQQPHKGLSYQIDGPLSMALDPDLEETAAGLLARLPEEELRALFAEFGQLRESRRFAARIVESRRRGIVPQTTAELVRVLRGERREPLAEADLSRVFQALRVAVVGEMERLERFLDQCDRWIRPGGRLVIIAYAGHEDARIKEWMRQKSGSAAAFRPLHRGVIRPGPEEVRANRRARSARLRALERGGN